MMKMSNSVLCAVVVAVLGLSAALSAQQSATVDERVYPADMCGKLGVSGANITRNGWGGIVNRNTQGQPLYISCGAPNVIAWPTASTWVSATDRHPTGDLSCYFVHVARRSEDSQPVYTIHLNSTTGARNSLQFMGSSEPDSDTITGPASTNFVQCIIPPPADDGAVSEIHAYGVRETSPVPSGISPAMLPPDEQARQAGAAVHAREMRVEQALNTEKEDPKWSQKVVTAWTQIFQQEGIKEELKGIQLDTIECRTTLCRVKLTPTAPSQGDAVFGEELAKLLLLAPGPVQGFGTIENPDGQAPVAVLYIAREGHRLP